MFCKNCGKEVDEKAFACPGCGVPPKKGKKFCQHCGEGVEPEQVMCVKCGGKLSGGGLASVSGGSGEKTKLVAGLLAILFGAFGVHKFYLGDTKNAIIRIAITLVGSLLFGLGGVAMMIVALIEGITYLTMDDSKFEETYVSGSKAWL